MFVCGKAKDLLRGGEKEQNRMVPLTQTEKEILRAMALGKSTKEIAAERFLSVYTAEITAILLRLILILRLI